MKKIAMMMMTAASVILTAAPLTAPAAAAEDLSAKITISVEMDKGYVLKPTEITVTDVTKDGKLDFDDALIIAHDLYYPGGAAAGMTQTTIWGREGAFGCYISDENGELDEVYLLYTDMINSNLQEPRTLRLLPFERRHFGKAPDGTMKKLPKASFVPSPEKVMDYLIPNYAKGIIYGAMVEAFCCEQQSRMTAMDAATNSAKDMIKDLSLLYNRARQAAITQEITEVCGGAASLDD